MRSVQSGPFTGPIIGMLAQWALLATLSATVGLGGAAWVVGGAYGLVANVLLARGLVRRGGGLGPADRVTLVRAVLAGAVAALVMDSFGRPEALTTIVTIAAVALSLDAVDGRVARRTHTVSTLGARFDMEVDAFLILALSVWVARFLGPWVLLIGLARYAFVGAGLVLPWLREVAPPRHWCKVVAALQGIALTVVAARVLPDPVAGVALVLALALLAESFGREAWWLWRHRLPDRRTIVLPASFVTVAAAMLSWIALVAPNRAPLLTPVAFLRIPAEALVIGMLALFLRPKARIVMSMAMGVALGLVLIVKLLDIGFFMVFDRGFDLLNDWFYVGPGIGVLGDSVGRTGAVVVVVLALVVLVAVLVAMPLAVTRLTRIAAEHRLACGRAFVVLGVAWLLGTSFGIRLGPSGGVASASAADLVYGQVSQLRHDLADRRAFATDIATDPLLTDAGGGLLAGLRGKDVLVVFVESYGRVAVQDSTFAPGVDAVLESGTRDLRAAGFSSQSAFLTSPTFGAGSWLAHSTLQSGLWVNSQQRYNQLLTHDRATLSSIFAHAGWRTVFDVPANTLDWPQGAQFYDFDRLYDARNVGYRGPKFSYATMPDQYVLSAFHRLELAKANRPPVMAEIDLVSSHHPWTPLPQLVPWTHVGDGSVFAGMQALGESPEQAFSNPANVRALYGKSIEYTLNTLFSYLTTYPDPNLVVIVVGDHQPHSYVSGAKPGHDVPVSIIAHDPAVLARVNTWGWQDGMLPGRTAPIWRMDTFRDRFVSAYGPAANSSAVSVVTAAAAPTAAPQGRRR